MGWTLVLAGVVLATVGVLKAVDVYREAARIHDEPWPTHEPPSHVRTEGEDW